MTLVAFPRENTDYSFVKRWKNSCGLPELSEFFDVLRIASCFVRVNSWNLTNIQIMKQHVAEESRLTR